MAELLGKIEIVFEVGAIQVVRTSPLACCACKGRTSSWLVVATYGNSVIFQYHFCERCYERVKGEVPQFMQSVKESAWVPLHGGLPAYFDGRVRYDFWQAIGLPEPTDASGSLREIREEGWSAER